MQRYTLINTSRKPFVIFCFPPERSSRLPPRIARHFHTVFARLQTPCAAPLCRKACHLPRNLYHFADQQRRFYKAIHALLYGGVFRISCPFRGSARTFSKLNDRSEGLQGAFSKLDDHSEGLKGLFFKFDDHSEGLRGLFSKLDDHSEGLQGTFASRMLPFGGQNGLLPPCKTASGTPNHPLHRA